MYLKEKFEEENDNEKERNRRNRCGCKRERERESRRVKKNCSLFDVQKAKLKEYINEGTGYRKKQEIANFTDSYNEKSKEMRCESKNAEEDFFRDVDVVARKEKTFTENSPSFLCALRNQEKLKKAEYEQEYKLKSEKNRAMTDEKWETIIASSKKKLASERGITLLALILTVVIMIILAAVTINVTLGDGGLIDQAQHAAEVTVNSTKSEQEQLDDLVSQLNEIIGGSGGTGGGETNTTPGEDTNQIEETNTIDPEPEPPEPLPDGTISIGEPDWQDDGTANVTVSTTAPDVTIEYQIGGTDENSWIPVVDGMIEGIENGETVYVRITDGEQYSNPQNKKIEDLAAPEKANIEVTPASVLIGENLTAKVTHVDNETGVDIENSKWVVNQSSSEIGTEDTGAFTGKFTTNGETITLDSSSAGTYYLHILTTDVAGNKTETVSEAITIGAIIGTVIQSGDVTWSAGQASISLVTTESQYAIVYKINGEGSWTEYNGIRITGLSHGDTVTACLTNASQTTYGPEAEFEIKDETDPTVTVTAQGSPSTNSITVTAQASDNESGMVASPTYTFQYKASGEGSYTTPSDASDISSATYTFTGLTQGTSYDIQVIVNGDVAGNTGTGLEQATTETVPGADEGLETGAITASPVTWSGGKASTTLTTNTSFKIQYQINGVNEGSWSEVVNSPVTVSNLDHGNTVYARLTDGVNAGDYAAINIVDGIAPTVSVEVGEVTDTSIAVTVNATDNESGLASSNAYKYYLNEEENPRETSSSNTYTYTSLTAETPYNIRVEVMDKGNNTGTGTVQTSTVEPPAYIDSVLPTSPMLGEGMTPVKWDGNNWIKTTVTDNEWYDYSNKEWANVVLDDAEFNDNILNENKPYSMFVWIPRYAYQITSQYHQSGTSGGNINIVFIDTNNKGKDGKIYSETYPTYNTGSGMSDFVVHPAFNYGNNKENKLRGLWIGKFDSSSQEGNQNNSRGDDVTNKTVQIKAGDSCWRYIRIGNIHTVCTEMNKEGNIYGLNSDDNIVDPHMLKNSEWGAITYLSYNEQYGQGNINRNNNSNYITGIGSDSTNTTATTTSTKNNYKTTYGQRASTTGNVTGIYDTVGGAAKYSAAYVSRADSNGSSLANSENRYKEVYPLYWSIRPSDGWYGDAIYETSSSGSDRKGSWFEEGAIFIQEAGGGYIVRGSATAMFGFGWDAGQPADYIGFRVVISVM